MGDVVPRPALTHVILDDAPGLTLAGREAVMRRIELALQNVPEKQRHYIGEALLEQALFNCRRRLMGID